LKERLEKIENQQNETIQSLNLANQELKNIGKLRSEDKELESILLRYENNQDGQYSCRKSNPRKWCKCKF